MRATESGGAPSCCVLDVFDEADFGDVLADDGFDAAFERCVRGGAAAAGAQHLHVGDVAVDADQPDVPAVHADRGADALEGRFDAVLERDYRHFTASSGRRKAARPKAERDGFRRVATEAT